MSNSLPKRRKISRNVLTAPFKSPLPRSTTTPSSSVDSQRHLYHHAGPTTSLALTDASAISSLHAPSDLASSPLHMVQAQHARLMTRWKTLRTARDTAAQALRLERTEDSGGRDGDAELVRLIGVWRAAGRAAAEELYGMARERINSMGGAQVWREREVERLQSRWEGQDEKGAREPDLAEDDAQEKSGAGAQDVQEAEQDFEREWATMKRERGLIAVDGDANAYTLDMMLRTLGIDARLLGFGVEEQRWMD